MLGNICLYRQKNFGLFFSTLSDIQAAHLLIETGKSDKEAIKIILSKFCEATRYQEKVT